MLVIARGGERTAEGEVSSPKAACSGDRTVVIRRVQAGDDPEVARARTWPNGHYNDGYYFVKFDDNGTRYRATVLPRNLPGPHRHICRGASIGTP